MVDMVDTWGPSRYICTMKSTMKVAVVGATGVVGQEMLRVLEQRGFPVSEIVPLASPRSAGTKVTYAGTEVTVREISDAALHGVRLALFSAGSGPSLKWAPIAAKAGALVVDNSSAWRMDPDVPLCVPEVNLADAKSPRKGIIANPNCSTIQMVVALKPIHDRARLKRVVVSTYQAASGAGAKAIEALHNQWIAIAKGMPADTEVLQGQLAGNVLMHWKRDVHSGYQEEELKMVYETQKIMGDASIRVSPTTVRVAVETGHSESIAVEAHTPLKADEVRAWLQGAPGVTVMDDFARGLYPTPLHATGKDDVFVGRIRDDIGNPGGVMFWVVSDNLRKGAALNAVQIAEGVLL
jgi:aspartate-semialdehyde dehydrogenase